MKHLLIIGARGWGREVYFSAQRTNEYQQGEYDIKGFLDSKTDALDGLRGDFPPIVGSVETYEIQPDDVFFCAMGEPKWRKHYADIIEQKGGKFITIIEPTAIVYPNAQIGEGSYIGIWTSVSDNVTIGRHVMIHGLCTLGHDVQVGDYSSLFTSVFLGGYAKVGAMSQMSPKSMIIPHKSVGDNVAVGAASVVMRNIKDGLHVHGNPAQKFEF